jgi:predicted anti-sigma-YlaC factor YlaD
MMHIIDEEILPFIENRLKPHEQVRVEAHLRECESCRAEADAARALHSELAEAGRAAGRLPVNPARGWAAVRERWRSPVAARVRNVSRRLSWQSTFSIAMTAIVFLSGVTFGAAQAVAPSVPYIQTPGVVNVVNDTATLSAVRQTFVSETPTLTLTPAFTLTPGPIETY